MDEDNPLGLKNSQDEGLDRKETSLLIEPALAQSETNVNNLYAKQTNGVFNFPKQIVNVPAGLKHCHLQETSSNLRQRKKDLCTPVFFFFLFSITPSLPPCFPPLSCCICSSSSSSYSMSAVVFVRGKVITVIVITSLVCCCCVLCVRVYVFIFLLLLNLSGR